MSSAGTPQRERELKPGSEDTLLSCRLESSWKRTIVHAEASRQHDAKCLLYQVQWCCPVTEPDL